MFKTVRPCLMLLLPLLCPPLWAQETRSMIYGRVLDPQSSAIAGARVVVTHLDTNTSSRLTTNETGYYEAPLLLPGKYKVSASASGFKTSVREGLSLQMSQTLSIDLKLDVGAVSETVEVISDAPILDTSPLEALCDFREREGAALLQQGCDQQRVEVRVRALGGELETRHGDTECFAISIGGPPDHSLTWDCEARLRGLDRPRGPQRRLLRAVTTTLPPRAEGNHDGQRSRDSIHMLCHCQDMSKLPAILKSLASQATYARVVAEARKLQGHNSRGGFAFALSAMTWRKALVFGRKLLPLRLGNRCSIRLSYGAVAQEDSVLGGVMKSCRAAVSCTACLLETELEAPQCFARHTSAERRSS